MSASRNQRRFFSSIVAKCTSCRLRGRGYTASRSPWGSSFVMCVELVVKGISLTCSSAGMRDAKVMLPPMLPFVLGMARTARLGQVRPFLNGGLEKQITYLRVAMVLTYVIFSCSSRYPVPLSGGSTIFVTGRTQSTGTMRNDPNSRLGHGVLGPSREADSPETVWY